MGAEEGGDAGRGGGYLVKYLFLISMEDQIGMVRLVGIWMGT